MVSLRPPAQASGFLEAVPGLGEGGREQSVHDISNWRSVVKPSCTSHSHRDGDSANPRLPLECEIAAGTFFICTHRAV